MRKSGCAPREAKSTNVISCITVLEENKISHLGCSVETK